MIYLALRFIMFVLGRLPLKCALVLGGLAGQLAYFFNPRPNRLGMNNLKAAFAGQKTLPELKKILRLMYKNMGYMLSEISHFPRLNKNYLRHFINVSGQDYAEEALKRGSGLIFLTAHFGNWELSAQVAAQLGYPVKVLARRQRYSRLNDLLNFYRASGGAEVITKGPEIKNALRTLKANGILGMLGDQDVKKGGLLVDFMGRRAATPEGPAGLALKLKCAVIPAFLVRERGAYHRLLMEEPLEYSSSRPPEEETLGILRQYHNFLSTQIAANPDQWLWIQKRWKSTPDKAVVVLSDRKAGHLNQSKAAAELLGGLLNESNQAMRPPYASEDGFETIEIKYKKESYAEIFNFICRLGLGRGMVKLAGRLFLSKATFDKLSCTYADYVISCGNKTAAANLLLASATGAKSISLMKPPTGVSRHNLVIACRHDNLGERANTVITEGALSLTLEKKLIKDKEKLIKEFNLSPEDKYLAFFIGGDMKNYQYPVQYFINALEILKGVSSAAGYKLLVTTSRRTGSRLEKTIKEQLEGCKNCALLVLAGDYNPDFAAGGMLGLAEIAVVTFDSVSMISEAAASAEYTIALAPGGVDMKSISKKHHRLIDNLSARGFLSISRPESLSSDMNKIINEKPAHKKLDDTGRVEEALKRIILSR